MTETLSLDAPRARLSLHLLAPADVDRVHAAALERLATAGLVPATAEARTALLEAGARDAARDTATGDGALCLAAELADGAAARAPKRIVLGGRGAGGDVVLQPRAALLGAGGAPAPQTEPLAGGRPKDATPVDLETACRLADALSDVAVIAGPPLSAAPVGDEAAQAADIVSALKATTKHVQLTGVTSAGAAAAAASIADVVRHDAADLRRRPPLSLLGGPGSFAAAAEFAHRGLPAGALIARRAPGGAERPQDVSPAELTEAVVGFITDVLGANAALQAIAPGTAFIAPVWPSLAGLPATGPSAAVFIVATTEVLTRVGLPVAAAAFATSAREPDWLACTQNSFAALSAAAAGAALLTGAGTLRGGAGFSPRQLVADAEIHSWCAAVLGGILVDDETLAVETIKDVGIGGNCLGQKHTRRHMRDVWRPRLLDRAPWEAWVADGRRGAVDKAAELTADLLARHEVEPLDAERAATLERIVACAGL